MKARNRKMSKIFLTNANKRNTEVAQLFSDNSESEAKCINGMRGTFILIKVRSHSKDRMSITQMHHLSQIRKKGKWIGGTVGDFKTFFICIYKSGS